MANVSTIQKRWRQVSPALSGGTRVNHAMCWDPVNRNIVMYGGVPGQPNTTYIWDGFNWYDTGATSPTAKQGFAMCFDEANGYVLMYGGQPSAGGTTNETWKWDGTAWTQLFPANSPPSAWEPRMASFGSSYVLAFGGSNLIATVYNQTWKWDGTNWTQLTPATTPAARFQHTMVYDPIAGQIIMHGGANYSSASFPPGGAGWGTYGWTGTDWTLLVAGNSANQANSQGENAGAWNPKLRQVCVFGGTGFVGTKPTGPFLNDQVWAYNRGGYWELIDLCTNDTTAPGPRRSSAWAWDYIRGRMLQEGGRESNGTSISSQTWWWGISCHDLVQIYRRVQG